MSIPDADMYPAYCEHVYEQPIGYPDGEDLVIDNNVSTVYNQTLNLEYLDTEKAQRMMDFLMGAMLVKGASFIEISKKVYTSVPKSAKVHYEGKRDLKGRFYNGSENDN